MSFNSVPILNKSSPILISLCKNLPYKESVETKISFKPSLANFCAVTKFIFSPSFTIIFPDFASIISSE